ncbi:hypothetical protein BDU57DRAFT_453747 [Ampelomyces quisqualis]|uniref:Zn(2)-C6 fungal-type domain-containing protein n=1 Tax=Ampelomyces quisqualis TaxID=50730 RepID=A0A6A5QHG9_AMPQU|nr:hypothetical protein BDU57DRAFT_453747 [Ampelomyces quisqualis]
MSTRSPDADSRENSPDHDGSPGGKRASKKRKVLSCFACRNRKMKCDRVYPVCGRCQKTGRADQCTYDPRLLEDFTGNNGTVHADGHHVAATFADSVAQDPLPGGTASFNALRFKARAQERRIAELERKLAEKEGCDDPSVYRTSRPAEPDGNEEMMFRGKGFKTQFHGSTSVMSTIAQFRELQAFTREALTIDHSIMRVKSDFKMFRDRRKVANKYKDAHIRGSDDEVFATLPDRTTVDLQVTNYFQAWETTYRILHGPSFWKEYQNFWEQPSGQSGQPGFAVILLLICATTKCLTPKDDVFEGDTTADRQMASNLIKVCEAWIGRQPRKRLTLQFFQLQCLSLVAKRVNCDRVKQDWIASGDVVRLALASGMHRNPSLLSTGKISPFEKEMKKRLWVTIMDLEMQSSLENGLQSSLTGLYWDTPCPANLPDEAFSAETLDLPASRPLEHFTTASFLSVSRKSIPLRLHLMQLLNNPSETMPYSEVMHYDAQLHELLSDLPKWEDARASLPTALLQLQLRQFLLILHKPWASLAHKNDRYIYSLTACINASGSIIMAHDELVSKGVLVLNNMRNDVLRVGLTLSRIIYRNCVLYGPVTSAAPPAPTRDGFVEPQNHFADLPSTIDSARSIQVSLALLPSEPFLARTLCTSAIDVLDVATTVYEHKVMRMGTGYMEYWLLAAAVGMLPPPSSSKPPTTSIAHIMSASDDIQVRCRKTLDRFQTLAFRVLALQKDPGNSFASSLRTTMASVSPSDVRTPRSGTGVAVAQSTRTGTTPPVAQQNVAYSGMPGIGMGAPNELVSKDMVGTFDNLQDMQVDLTGWNFPDFWAFDLGGDF